MVCHCYFSWLDPTADNRSNPHIVATEAFLNTISGDAPMVSALPSEVHTHEDTKMSTEGDNTT